MKNFLLIALVFIGIQAFGSVQAAPTSNTTTYGQTSVAKHKHRHHAKKPKADAKPAATPAKPMSK